MYSSSSISAATLAMRPGLIAGGSPEKEDRPIRWPDALANSIQGKLMRLTVDRQAGLHKVAAAVGRLGEALTGMDDARLQRQIFQLRCRFRSQGLRRDLCLEAMALIREVSARTLNMRHYDSQLMAGWTMLQGQLAEMETGEGKTLAATLPAACAALAGIPVHVITVNEYLVERDARIMAPLYQALGLTVGHVTQEMDPQERQAAYRYDITYCTNHQVAFDYLRDRLLKDNERRQLRQQLRLDVTDERRAAQLMLRGLCFAVIDEADSVLIDEARTPLILTRSIDSTDEHRIYCQALEAAKQLTAGSDFFLDAAGSRVRLSLCGQQKLARLTPSADGIWGNARRRDELIGKALHALHLLHKDSDYLVRDEKVVIIDVNTGRPMGDRSWERGLHQMVEAKEGCPLTDAREQLGRITYQRFFRRYLRLGGMSGTAREVGSEIWSVYGLRVQRIPLHRPSRRRALPDRVLPRLAEKWAAVIASVQEMIAQGRPVLIGTATVAESEMLSGKLTAAGIRHKVLNARQDEAEAQIVAAAGRRGQVSVATNMAGRGTDISLGEGVEQLGGLHVIAACRNEAKRIDRQLSGRCARHGDPGSHQAIVCLKDDLPSAGIHPAVIKVMERLAFRGGSLGNRINQFFIRRAQRKIERRHREARRALLRHDRNNDRLLAFSGNME